MSEFDFLNKSRKLIKELNWYLLHIGLFLVFNMTLTVYIFVNITGRWPLLFIVCAWAIALVYHGLRINNMNPLKKGKNPSMLQVILKMGGY